MKTHKHLLLAGLLAAIGLTAGAQPANPPAGGPGQGPAMHQRDGGHRGNPEQMRARMEERMAKRMSLLKKMLQITPAQEPAWTAFTNAMKPSGPMMQRPNRADFEKLTTPERIDRMRAMRNARMAEMDKRAEATKVFYAALNAEQKKTFDEVSAHMIKRGGGHRGHHGGGMGGMHGPRF